MPRPLRRSIAAVLGVSLAACGGSGSDSNSTPIGGNVPPQLVACRARIDQPFQFSEIALRDERNLGSGRVSDRAGTERCVRLHPDGVTVVFARERDNNDPDSREIFTSTIDGSRGELRLTQNTALDDEPCWSPDGQRILFTAVRNGVRSLWLIDAADGGNETAFTVVPAGSSDGEASWSAATDKVVWSRKGLDGRHVLWLANGNGTAAIPLTDGGATAGDGAGDRSPSFSPDGQQVVFVRRLGPELATLCLCDVMTGTVTLRLIPNGEVSWPRFAPAQDRLFFGLAEPGVGRQTQRLATMPVVSGNPTLVWPDQRWRLDGLDLLPGLPAAPVAGTPVTLDVLNAQLQLAAGAAVSGGRAELAAEDGDELRVLTANFEDRQIAGINCRFDLPVLLPTDVLAVQVRVVARSTRADGDSMLRLSIYNPVDERFDTAFELPAATAPRVMTFATSSLRHVTRERQLRVTVIGDLAPGSQAELRVDAVQVVFVPRL